MSAVVFISEELILGKYMQFHKAHNHVPHLNLEINNNEISRVDTFNFLGLEIKRI